MNSACHHFRFAIAFIALLLFSNALSAKEEAPRDAAVKLLPDHVGNFSATNAAMANGPSLWNQLFGEGSAIRPYGSADGSPFQVQLQMTENDSEAFALLTHARLYFHQFSRDYELSFSDPGTANFSNGSGIFFFKGSTFASVTAMGKASIDSANELARQLAAQLDAGEGEVPVLVKHLPDWQKAGKRAMYCVNLNDLKNAIATSKQGEPAQPVLDGLSFEGGTEAVVAAYDQSQLAIVEFTTPQLSIDNDSRIWTKIAELKSQGQPTPTAYRRIGNYSVFVFNAPDNQTANALIDQVKYEQVVQWLGDDPHLYDKLQRYLTQTSAGVLIAVLKSSGLSLVLCLGVGGLLGAILFRHRRAQRATAFSDAGGSIRLNLDELTGPSSSRLLSSGKRADHDGD